MTDIAFPTLTRSAPPELTWGIVWNTQVFEAPETGSIQTVENPGARWRAQMQFPNLEEADATLLQAWLMKLRGRANRALIHNFARPNVRGTMTGTPLVNGASQTGSSLVIDGGGNARTLLAGDFFGVGGKLKMVVADMTTDASGNGTITFEPPIPSGQSPADNASITLVKPTCRMIMESDSAEWLTRAPILTDVPLSFIEVFS
jgi:hypothetical protein